MPVVRSVRLHDRAFLWFSYSLATSTALITQAPVPIKGPALECTKGICYTFCIVNSDGGVNV